MNYAIIKFDPNSGGLGDVVSRHRTEENANRALDRMGNVRNHYVALLKPSGDWERYLEARDRWESGE
jgi:hypothetical protein